MRRLLTVVFVCIFMMPLAHAVNLPDFTGLVKQVAPAVVNISTTQKIKHPHMKRPNVEIPDLPEDSPWGDLLRKFFGDDNNGPEEFNTQSLGSGFIIDSNGYIITNNHVIKNADEIIVRLSDRRELKAKLIGTDPRSDVALLKIDAKDLPVVKLGDSDKLQAGQWVMAIGSPFGFDHSVSAGIVSAIGRNLPSENYVPFIQTDVAINPGNSGGPLFNMDGEVVGINSQIYSRTGGFMGLSFAIPINVATSVVKQLREKGKVSRGWLGILIQDINRELAESFGMKEPMGAVVLKVLDDSPAKKAGFKIGDVVVEFNGKKIERSSDLPIAVGSTPVGETAKVKVIREGKPVELSVKIAELPSEDKLASSEGKENAPAKANRIGIVVDELSPEQRRRLDMKKGGIIVKEVTDGPAADAGIIRGDVLLRIDGHDINGVRQFHDLLEKLPKGKPVPMLIQRNNSPIFLALKIPK
ncbi:MAG: Do family serine endopeptidase [Gammaproteobacteria bacterium]|nr:Do family serine endopeptidase [Gammaproteobacteria bacterium]